MAPIKALSTQLISKIVSESSENTFNLEISDESSCNIDVDILELISATTREPENSVLVRDKDSRLNADFKVDNLSVPPTLCNISVVGKCDSKTDLKTKVANMPPTVNFDFCNVNCLSSLSCKGNSLITDSAIDDLLSTLAIDESKTCTKSGKDCIDSNLIDFLEKTDVESERIDNCRNEVSNGNHQQKSRDQISSLSLATLAEFHFLENHLDSFQESEKIPDNETTKNSSILFNDSKNDVKELHSHDEDIGISLSELAESYLRCESETVNNSISSGTLAKKNDSEEAGHSDILSFISSINSTEENCGSIANYKKEKFSFDLKGNKNTPFSELLETKEIISEGHDHSKLSSETDSHSLQTSTKKISSDAEDLDILSFINSVNNAEDDCSSNCSKEKLSLNVRESDSCAFGELLETEDNSDEGYDSGKLSPEIDLNRCIKIPTTSSQFFKSSLFSDNCNVLQPQDDSIKVDFAFASTAKIQNENVLNKIPKPSIIHRKQSLFAKALSCNYHQQNETAAEKVSNIKKQLFEKYFCTTDRDILRHVPHGKKLIDKSAESVIPSGYLHFSACPAKN